MDLTKTAFLDLRNEATEVIRVTTTQHLYFVAFHSERNRRYVIVRGQEGSDREHVVIRDSDPRIGERSMFEVPVAEWIGQVMEVATMRTSAILKAEVEPSAAGSLRQQLKMQVEPPAGMAASPRIVHGLGRGTSIGASQPRPVNPPSPAAIVDQAREAQAREAARAAQASSQIARQTVVGDQQLPYPLRHVVYAENVVAFMRSIHRRDSLFADIAHDPELRGRYLTALEDMEDLLRLLRRRAK